MPDTTPRERPIIFSAELVRKLLAGSKTQTRRVVKPQPPPRVCRLIRQNDGAYVEATPGDMPLTGDWDCRCPYGEPGDHLWVKEAAIKIGHERTVRGCYPWPKFGSPDDGRHWFDKSCEYAADLSYGHPLRDEPHGTLHPWYMPRWASRITLEITGVRVERLHDITEQDAAAEGFCETRERIGNGIHWSSARGHFVEGWDRINGKRHPWDSSPWVWAISFQQLSQKGGGQ